MMITPGSTFNATDLDYVGNHKRHAKSATASDHIACTFTTASLGTCNGQIAIGGFMLLANAVTVNFAANNITVPINGGTGKYAHARGSATRRHRRHQQQRLHRQVQDVGLRPAPSLRYGPGRRVLRP